MPIYEYRCTACGRRSSLFFRSIASAEAEPACPHCGERALARRMSRVWAHAARSADVVDAEAFDPGASVGDDGDWYGDDGWDGPPGEDDPIGMAREMRAMAAMSGEPLEPELERALEHIEAGADPDDVLGELDAAEEATAEPPDVT